MKCFKVTRKRKEGFVGFPSDFSQYIQAKDIEQASRIALSDSEENNLHVIKIKEIGKMIEQLPEFKIQEKGVTR